jgi:4-hydroxy-3-polyprenylbenzoate decarboxylase
MRDLREFLTRLEEAGELNVIEEPISWDQEAAGICAMTNRVGGPAVLFKNVKGYPEGYQLAGSLLAGGSTLWPDSKRSPWSRLLVAMEMENNTSYSEVLQSFLDRRVHTLHATELSSGPCKEVIQKGNDVNLLGLPFPKIHDGDAGRYSTMHNVIVKNPFTGWQEWGASRVMVADEKTMVASFLPEEPSLITIRGEYVWQIYQEYEKQDKPMPICITLGGPPELYLASLFPLDPGIDRAELAGGFGLSPVELTKAETCDLMVPSTAEIIIEGEVPPRTRQTEGPFGEKIAGYSDANPQPIINVKAITHRKNPILPFSAEGFKICDSMAVLSVTLASEVLRKLRAARETSYTMWVEIPPEWGLAVCVVSMVNAMPGCANLAANAVLGSSPIGRLFDKVLVVDADSKPGNLVSFWHDIHQKMHPTKQYVSKGLPMSPVIAYADDEMKKKGTSTKAHADLMWPITWSQEDVPVRLTFETCFPKEIRDRVLDRWVNEFKIPIKPIVFE